MGVVDDIVATYRRPRHVIGRLIAAGQREDRALAILMGASAVIFISQWPRAARQAHLDPAAPLDARLAGALLASVFLLPLAAYLVAMISHGMARMVGGTGTAFGARIALFWALMAIAPLMLLHGLLEGLAGPGAAPVIAGAMIFGLFLWIWLNGLWVAERTPNGEHA